MRKTKFTLTVLMFILSASVQQQVLADDAVAVKQYSIKQSTATVGTNFKKEIVKTGTIPLDKSYDQLTPDQVRSLKNEYDSISDADEPPFPLKGLLPIYRAIGNAHESLDLQYKGSLSIFVLVDSEGNAKSTTVMVSPNENITNAAVIALMKQKYKPAVCAGKPCEMQFPLHAVLVGPVEDNMSNANTTTVFTKSNKGQ